MFREMVSKIQRRGLVIVISDLFGDLDRLLKALAHFRHAKHEMMIFQIWDPDELDFPFRQWTQFASLEQTGHEHLVDPAQLRKAYLEKLGEYRDQLHKGCSRHRIHLVPMTTDQPYSDVLAAYLGLRRKSK